MRREKKKKKRMMMKTKKEGEEEELVLKRLTYRTSKHSFAFAFFTVASGAV